MPVPTNSSISKHNTDLQFLCQEIVTLALHQTTSLYCTETSLPRNRRQHILPPHIFKLKFTIPRARSRTEKFPVRPIRIIFLSKFVHNMTSIIGHIKVGP